MKCTICNTEIDGTMIGTGDGTGQKFAHAVCYRAAELLDAVREMFYGASVLYGAPVLRADKAHRVAEKSEALRRFLGLKP